MLHRGNRYHSATMTTREEVLMDRADFLMGYIHDAALVAVKAIDKIINNCESLKNETFCKKIEYSAEDVGWVVKQITVQGATGEISFNGIDRISNLSMENTNRK
ncbi:hypothetical protein O9G_001906 [Rozella allomycis CSF55]|uniref:Uncharacterized protein n=1 Tax=Rozella allomycis (strain CSF55) TaxID=988480 RepID=A0A075AWW3_ROZAC|nr:hypothetical protein O9G_001906 [Rozella allomycis CSF55]|eukprot:EPZ34604.1 hypothetical protein O9G_001906 [Rozella allomycis CSF55]